MKPDIKKGKTRQPRFDFRSNPDPGELQTATLRELLDELNYERTYRANGERAIATPTAGAEVTAQSLELTLAFIQNALGESIQGTADPLPLSTVKTIKLLYLTNDASDTQLYRRLARPDEASATMEHWDSRNSSRNDYTTKIVSELMATIYPELNTTKSWRIETILLSTSKLLECMERENFEILTPIYEQFQGDDQSLTRAFSYMAKIVSSYHPAEQPRPAVAAPLHEKLYIYLRTLPFFHFVGEYKRHFRAEESVGVQAHLIQSELKAFCERLSSETQLQIDESVPITSISEFPQFLSRHAQELCKLVQHATGIKSERRDLLGISDAVRKVLHAYVFHQWHRTPPTVVNLTVTDCVAAVATIRIQQKEKTPYTPQWVGQDSSGMTVTRLLSHLDSTRSIEELYEEDYIPQGALQILYHRFCIVYSKISGRDQRQLAWMEFQLARQAKYAECFANSDIDYINQELGRFIKFCMRSAFSASLPSEPCPV
jgi:hypothetical protein